MTPYEVYFYSSGGVEERWAAEGHRHEPGERDRRLRARRHALDRADDRRRHGLPRPRHLARSTSARSRSARSDPLGKIGLLLALVGILFAVGGASIDTVFAGAYNLAQFCGWEWGRYRHPRGAPRFTLTWIVLLVLAMGIVMTGVDPVVLTEYAVIFSVVALPLTYLPILLVANDRAYMGRYGNGRLANVLGLVYLVVIMVVALTAIPLMILTNAGQN